MDYLTLGKPDFEKPRPSWSFPFPLTVNKLSATLYGLFKLVNRFFLVFAVVASIGGQSVALCLHADESSHLIGSAECDTGCHASNACSGDLQIGHLDHSEHECTHVFVKLDEVLASIGKSTRVLLPAFLLVANLEDQFSCVAFKSQKVRDLALARAPPDCVANLHLSIDCTVLRI